MKTYNDKQYKEVLPCGIIRTTCGMEYYLLHPEPIVKDSWQRDEQQRFVVVPNGEEYILGHWIEDEWVYLYSYSRHLITTNPDIEYCCFRNPILVEYLGELDVTRTELEPPLEIDLNEDEELALAGVA